MKIETKYNIGDTIRYNNNFKYADKTRNTTEVTVGIISSVVLFKPSKESGGTNYYVEHYGGHIKESDVVCRLVPESDSPMIVDEPTNLFVKRDGSDKRRD